MRCTGGPKQLKRSVARHRLKRRLQPTTEQTNLRTRKASLSVKGAAQGRISENGWRVGDKATLRYKLALLSPTSLAVFCPSRSIKLNLRGAVWAGGSTVRLGS